MALPPLLSNRAAMNIPVLLRDKVQPRGLTDPHHGEAFRAVVLK
jgi:hypothetical protein